MTEAGAEGSQHPDPQELTIEDWKRVTSTWSKSSMRFAYYARALPFPERRRQSGELLATSETLHSHVAQQLAEHVAVIYSLSDGALDKAIRSFSPDAS